MTRSLDRDSPNVPSVLSDCRLWKYFCTMLISHADVCTCLISVEVTPFSLYFIQRLPSEAKLGNTLHGVILSRVSLTGCNLRQSLRFCVVRDKVLHEDRLDSC